MYSNGKFKRGDSVLRVDGESFKHGDKMKYVYSITDKDSVQVSECSGIWKNEDIRHATPEEKYWMETLERNSIADFRHGDIFIDAEGAELVLGGMWELNDAAQWYKDDDFKGIYPAESFKRYPQEDEYMEIRDMDEYQLLAKRTQPQLSKRDLLLNMTIGICGEGGELADTVKKEIYHGHEVDDLAKAKELGDILWYVANAADVLGYSLQEIAEMNIEKLRKRFPNGFSTVDSIKRVDTL